MLMFLRSLKPSRGNAANIDNNIFACHYKFTTIALGIFAALITSKQYFGEPIKCLNQGDSIRTDVLDSYCWIHGTYTVKKHLTPGSISEGAAAYPGVGPMTLNEAKDFMWGKHEDESIVTHKYYQWVCIIFGLQAALFYVPRYLWKGWENGLVETLLKGIRGPVATNEWTRDRRNYLIHYFLSRKYSHNGYAFRFAFCELLNLSNVIAQIFFVDWFLGGQFSSYGYAVMSFAETGILPMDAAFPKMTKCSFFLFGPSGSMQSRDTLCILPLNVVNEKLFFGMWLWFLILLIATGLSIIYRFFLVCSPSFRAYLLLVQARYIHRKTANAIVRKFSYGDWFLLHQLGKNLNSFVYKDFIKELGNAIKEKVDISFNSEVNSTEPV